MKTAADSQPGPGVAQTPQPVTPSFTEVSAVLTSAARNIQLMQSKAGADLFARSVENVLSALSPGHAPYWLQQLPLHYRLQAMTLMASAADTYSEGVQAQQALLASVGQWPFLSAPPWADPAHLAPPTAHSRRVARRVISFPDRRVA